MAEFDIATNFLSENTLQNVYTKSESSISGNNLVTLGNTLGIPMENTLGSVFTKSESFIDINDLFTELQIDDIMVNTSVNTSVNENTSVNDANNNNNREFIFKSAAITDGQASNLYYYLKADFHGLMEVNDFDEMNHFDCVSHLVNPDDSLFREILLPLIDNIIKEYSKVQYSIVSIYVNYYKNAQLFVPNYIYRNKHQLILTLGNPHILKIENNDWLVCNGDAVICETMDRIITESNNNNMQINVTAYLA